MRRALSDRRVLVTGGSSGIGAAAAVALARRGAMVAVSGRDTAALDSVAAVTGGPALAADLRCPGAAADLVDRAARELGGINAVVCSAGAGWAGPLATMPAAEIDSLIDLNFRAAIHTVRAALPRLVDAPPAHVVLVGSVAARIGVPGEVVYSATKAGLAGFADALRAELADSGVRVCLVNPAAVATAFFDRRNRPYERAWPQPMPVTRVAEAVVRCVDAGASSEVVVPGWMAFPVRLRGVAPRLYWALAHRFT